MGEIKKIIVDCLDVTLQNEGKLNTVTAYVDLRGIWNTIINYTNIIVEVILMIPIIEQGASENIKLVLEESYLVKEIDPLKQSVSLVGKFPGILKLNGEKAKGEARVTLFDVI